MRAREFIAEDGRTGSILPSVAAALPTTYALPELLNQDPYMQYRFGVALAAVRGSKERAADKTEPFTSTSAWGENQIVVSLDPEIEKTIDAALKLLGRSKKIMISTPNSTETKDVGVVSPVPDRNKLRK